MLPVFQSPLNITTELCTVEQRSFVIGIACIAWAIGQMALPLVGWIIKRWVQKYQNPVSHSKNGI